MVSWLGTVFSALAVLFTVYLIRTALRSATTVEVDATGLRTTGPLGRAIRWGDLTGIELRYFATRRDKEGGWMQMQLQAGGRTNALESTPEDFPVVAERAVGEAARNRARQSGGEGKRVS